MKAPITNYSKNGYYIGKDGDNDDRHYYPADYARVRWEMRNVGLSAFGMQSLEGKYLPHIIHAGEHILGVIFGYQDIGFCMLAVTSTRVIFLDRKPLFMKEDEISFDIIGGVTLSNSLFWTNINLHTKLGDYKMLTFNRRAASKFANYVELRCLEHNNERTNNHD